MKKQTNGQTVCDCPLPDELPRDIVATLDVLGGKWKLLILWHLWKRERRFGELKKMLNGVTQHMLTVSLRQMEQDGLVRRTVFAEVPPRVEYALTEHGQSLGHVFSALKDWGEQHRLFLTERNRQNASVQ